MDKVNLMLPPVRLVIYGGWTESWMSALGPTSEIWRDHPIIKEVTIFLDVNSQKIPPSADPKLTTILLPLMEWHIIKSPKNYLALISEDEVINTLAIKSNFDDYINRINLAHITPKTYKTIDLIKFPVILKRVDLNAGSGIAYIKSMSSLEQHLQNEHWFQKPVILQEFIDGEQEYTTHMICKEGEILWHTSFYFELTPHNYIRTPMSIVHTERVEVGKNILLKLRECLKPLNFNGVCNIDYKFTHQGELKIFEINPRFGGTLMAKENQDLLRQAIDFLIHAVLTKDFDQPETN